MKTFFGILLLHLGILLITRFIAWPENLLWPYLNQNGISYYKGLFLIYTPIYWWLLSLFYGIFGIGTTQLIIFSWSIILFTDILLFVVSKRKIWPLLLYIPLQIFFEGNGVWPDHLLAPLFLAVFYFWQSKRFFLLGIFLGLSLMTKQTALYLILFVTMTMVWRRSWRELIRTFAGLFFITMSVVLYLFSTNSLAGFWDSSIKYIFLFHSKYSLQTQLPTISQLPLVLLLITITIVAIFKKTSRQFVPWIVFATLGVFTRFEYFHLQPALPFIALALGTSGLALFPYALFLIFFGRFITHNILVEPRFMDKSILDNAKAITEVVGNEKKIMVINSWDHYYFLTNTLPINSNFVPSTPWTMDYPENKKRFALAIAQNSKYIVYNKCLLVKGFCYRPEGISEILEKNYLKKLELPDGTGIFEYNPVSLR